MKNEIDKLKSYSAKSDRIKMLKTVVKNVSLPYGGIKRIIKGFEDGDFLIKDFDKQADDKQDE